jgi:hypothetical protein
MTSPNTEPSNDKPQSPPPVPKLPVGYKPTETVVSYRGSGPLRRPSDVPKPKR